MARRKTSSTLAVWCNGKRVGQWQNGGSAASQFRYDESWLNDASAFPLSITMPLAPAANYRGAIVDAFFDNLLPDNRDILMRLQARFKTASYQAHHLLAEIGRDCVGALQIVPDEQSATDVQHIQGVPLSDKEIENILNNVTVANADQHDDDFRLSIAGAQEKTGLLWHNQQWHRPIGTTPTTHIFKLPLGQSRSGIDLKTSIENEWCCAQILKGFGLPVAHSTMKQFGERKALIVERFDRRLSTHGSWWQRLHQEDFCQATGTPPALKYEADGGPGIQTIMTMLLGSQQAQANRQRFLQTQLLFYFLAAIDGHAKNFSVQFSDGGRFQLAPSYDVMSAYPMLGKQAGQLSPHKIKMAMSFSGKNKHYHHHEIQLHHIVSTFEKAGLSASIIQSTIADLIDKAPSVIAAVSALKIPDDFDHATIEAILTGFENALRCA